MQEEINKRIDKWQKNKKIETKKNKKVLRVNKLKKHTKKLRKSSINITPNNKNTVDNIKEYSLKERVSRLTILTLVKNIAIKKINKKITTESIINIRYRQHKNTLNIFELLKFKLIKIERKKREKAKEERYTL